MLGASPARIRVGLDEFCLTRVGKTSLPSLRHSQYHHQDCTRNRCVEGATQIDGQASRTRPMPEVGCPISALAKFLAVQTTLLGFSLRVNTCIVLFKLMTIRTPDSLRFTLTHSQELTQEIAHSHRNSLRYAYSQSYSSFKHSLTHILDRVDACLNLLRP